MIERNRSADRTSSAIVAVIRMKDPGKLRAVVDALAEGGVRALEVTMTVPGAVELIRGAGADAAGRIPARRRHGHRRGDRAARSSTPARSFVVSRCSGAR